MIDVTSIWFIEAPGLLTCAALGGFQTSTHPIPPCQKIPKPRTLKTNSKELSLRCLIHSNETMML